MASIMSLICIIHEHAVLVGDKLYGLSYAKRGQFFAMEA